MSIEGIKLEHFSYSDQEKSSSTSHSYKFNDMCSVFLSYNSKEDVSTTAAHSNSIIELFKIKQHFIYGISTKWENTDVCE